MPCQSPTADLERRLARIVAVARHLIQRILGIINWDDRTVRKLYEHRAIPFELYDLPEHC